MLNYALRHEGMCGSGGISPQNSEPQYYTGVSGDLHVRVALSTVPIVQEAGWAPELV